MSDTLRELDLTWKPDSDILCAFTFRIIQRFHTTEFYMSLSLPISSGASAQPCRGIYKNKNFLSSFQQFPAHSQMISLIRLTKIFRPLYHSKPFWQLPTPIWTIWSPTDAIHKAFLTASSLLVQLLDLSEIPRQVSWRYLQLPSGDS